MTNTQSVVDTKPSMDLLVHKVDSLTDDEMIRIDLLCFGIQYDQTRNGGSNGGVKSVRPEVASYFQEKAKSLNLPLATLEVNLATIGRPDNDARAVEGMAIDWGTTREKLLQDNNFLETRGPVQVALLVNVEGGQVGQQNIGELSALLHRLLDNNGSRVAVCFKFENDEQISIMEAENHLRPIIRATTFKV
ncbi:hypothetical protein KBC75_04925 [Candidatus Shapirobacteria bacterium]|nr:hypothetical protein [Candidatus Shapirobacteria bacterium]